MWPQYKTVYDPNRKDFDMDFIGRYDTLQKDFDEVCDRLDIKKGTLPHLNAAWPDRTYPHYSTYYTPETAAMIAKLYAYDIDLFKFRYKEL